MINSDAMVKLEIPAELKNKIEQFAKDKDMTFNEAIVFLLSR